MGWIRIDDGLPEHPKFDQAGPLAGWLWLCGMGYCNRNLTDGRISKERVPLLSTVPKPEKEALRLVEAGLWVDEGDAYRVNDYLTYQPSREKVLAERAAAAERKARSRGKSQRDSGVTGGVTDGVTHAGSHGGSHTTPTQPNPKPLATGSTELPQATTSLVTASTPRRTLNPEEVGGCSVCDGTGWSEFAGDPVPCAVCTEVA